jgi:phosphoglycerol geranylgeranyltransferase
LRALKPIAQHIQNQCHNKQKGLALLLDPDKCTDVQRLHQTLQVAESGGVDYLFVGGSLLSTDQLDQTLSGIRKHSQLPVILFPGSALQVSNQADALLMLSLISGRNAELLIGQQVQAAPRIRACGLETLPTGYMLIDCGSSTTASYISQTMPIPNNKPEIAAVTALAGEMLGLRLFYLDGGSGARVPVNKNLIAAVRAITKLPIIVGGGIRTFEDALQAYAAGADIIVVGTAVEEDTDVLFDLCKAKKEVYQNA